jgi:hypothetical protein
MCKKSNRETYRDIIYDVYVQLSRRGWKNNYELSRNNYDKDKKAVAELEEKVTKYLDEFADASAEAKKTVKKRNRRMLEIKNLFSLFCKISRRNPALVEWTELRTRFYQLMYIIADREAEKIEAYMKKNMFARSIDLRKVFAFDRNRSMMVSACVTDVIDECIDYGEVSYEEGIRPVYLTRTGNKFHRADCKYCKGKKLNPILQRRIPYLDLAPCACIFRPEVGNDSREEYVTVFVDESIKHNGRINRSGQKLVGNFSYIIVCGDIEDERDIKCENLISQGYDYMKDGNHTETLAQAAIGKVMIKLAYEFNFHGHVKIYTDNKAAYEKWEEYRGNNALTKLFEGVTVTHIKRDKNTQADGILRRYIIADFMLEDYNRLVKQAKA